MSDEPTPLCPELSLSAEVKGALREFILIPQNIAADVQPIEDIYGELGESGLCVARAFVGSMRGIEQTLNLPFSFATRQWES